MSQSAECRICFGKETASMPSADEPEYLKNPKLVRMLQGACKCRGTMRYVHERCLLKWLQMKKIRRCDLCTAEITVREEEGDWSAQFQAIR